MAETASPRIRIDGKFFRQGPRKFPVKGVAYGPFAVNAAGVPFASTEQTCSDLDKIRELGANLIRIYEIPGKWFLDMASQRGLRVMLNVPWNQHVCFLDSKEEQSRALEAVRRAVFACSRHPAMFGFSV